MSFQIELPETCQWFALCTRPTEYVVSHPALGYVACCAQCVTRVAERDVIGQVTQQEEQQ